MEENTDILKVLAERVLPVTIFGSLSDETWYSLIAQGREEHRALAAYLPDLPPEKFQGQVTALKSAEGLRQGFKFYQLFKKIFLDRGGIFSKDSSVLDFGCGWGRITRFFLKDVYPERLFGIDVNDEAIAHCRATNRWCTFLKGGLHPPTEFEAGKFDLVFANSVFSHLPEDIHLEWLSEIRRILKPEGMLIATTLSRETIVNSAKLSHGGIEKLPLFQQRLAQVFSDLDHWLGSYDRNEFCFASHDSQNPNYGFACIPRGYVERKWTSLFASVEYLSDRKLHPQDIIIASASTRHVRSEAGEETT